MTTTLDKVGMARCTVQDAAARRPYLKPGKIVVPLAVGLAWKSNPCFRYEEKLDGQFHVREMGDSIVAGELMKDGRFYAFDCLVVDGRNIMRAPLRDRLECLSRFSFLLPAVGNGGEFLEAVLARGGEGVVAKDLNSPWGTPMLACKRLGTWLCRVTSVGNSQSVDICDASTGVDRGSVKLCGGKCDRVRIGSIIKVEGMQLTATGKIREPRLCKDTSTSWLVKF